MSSTDSATHRASLRDVFGRILDGEDLSPQTLMDAYVSVSNLIVYGPTPLQVGDGSPACVEAYSFVRDSISEHIHTKVNEAETRDVPNLAPTSEALETIDAAWHNVHRHYLAKHGLEGVSAFAVRTFRETAVKKILSDPQLLSDWLEGAIEGVRQGSVPRDDVKSYGRRLLEIFEISPDDYATRISMPFIRDAVALFHEKAKTLVSDDAFEARKTQILEIETRRAEVYLHEPHRSDYVATITELFGTRGREVQRP
ncbi:hypothetical protein AAVH_16553 [Aphelenchoides avenae]|nr:hypothetical protein AAVH_16553 [Aphelenchus avenae]